MTLTLLLRLTCSLVFLALLFTFSNQRKTQASQVPDQNLVFSRLYLMFILTEGGQKIGKFSPHTTIWLLRLDGTINCRLLPLPSSTNYGGPCTYMKYPTVRTPHTTCYDMILPLQFSHFIVLVVAYYHVQTLFLVSLLFLTFYFLWFPFCIKMFNIRLG